MTAEGVFHSARCSDKVYPVVAVEAFVLGRNQGMDESGGNGIVRNGGAIFAEELA